MGLALLLAALAWNASQRNWYQSIDLGMFLVPAGILLAVGALFVIVGASGEGATGMKLQPPSVPTFDSGEDAISMAKRRLAAGEITSQEYDEIASRL